MKKLILLPLHLFFFVSLSSACSILQAPTRVTRKKLHEKVTSIELDMTWCFGQRGSISFPYRNGKTLLQINLDESPINQLATDIKKSFVQQPNDPKIWRFSVGENLTKNAHENETSQETEPQAAPLQVTTEPTEISVTQLAELMQNKKCCFYTGAGISAGAVPTMSQLNNILFNGEPCLKTIINAIESIVINPQPYLEYMHNFYCSCLTGEPTSAHNAITQLAIQNNWSVLTENVDLLHEQSGIQPIKRNQLFTEISSSDLAKLDIVIAIGLSEDQSNFLSWYKQHNPQGIIVGININDVCYLSSNDYLIKGDIQITLPKLANKLSLKGNYVS